MSEICDFLFSGVQKWNTGFQWINKSKLMWYLPPHEFLNLLTTIYILDSFSRIDSTSVSSVSVFSFYFMVHRNKAAFEILPRSWFLAVSKVSFSKTCRNESIVFWSVNFCLTCNSFKKWPLNFWWISNKSIIEVGNITKAATFKSFLQLSCKNTQLLFLWQCFLKFSSDKH